MIEKIPNRLASWLVPALAAVLVIPGPVEAQNAAASGSDVRVSGDIRVDGRATVGSWDCEVADFDTEISLAENAGGLAFESLEEAVTAMSMSVSAAMECDDGGDMDEGSREALEVEDHPTVDFEMEEYRVVGMEGTEAQVEVDGTMEISGTERPVTIPFSATPEDDGLRVVGDFELDITEYDVDPPRMMLGAIRVRSDVEISFDLFLEEG